MFSYVQPSRISFRRWAAAVALAVVSLITFPAMAVTAGDLFNPVTGQISGSSTLLDFGANGNFSRVFTPSAAATIVSDGSNTLALSRVVYVPNPAGLLVPVNVGARVPLSAVAVLVKKALPLVPVLSNGVALYDLAKEIGYLLDKTSGNVIVSQIVNTLACTTAPCPLFIPNYGFAPGVGGLVYADQLCGIYMAKNPGATLCSVADASTGVVNWKNPVNNNGNQMLIGPSGVSSTNLAEAAIYAPATLQDLENAIASASGWPSNLQFRKH